MIIEIYMLYIMFDTTTLIECLDSIPCAYFLYKERTEEQLKSLQLPIGLKAALNFVRKNTAAAGRLALTYFSVVNQDHHDALHTMLTKKLNEYNGYTKDKLLSLAKSNKHIMDKYDVKYFKNQKEYLAARKVACALSVQAIRMMHEDNKRLPYGFDHNSKYWNILGLEIEHAKVPTNVFDSTTVFVDAKSSDFA